MRYRKLTSNGDYTFGTGSDFYANSPEAVGQAVRTRLALWEGEWFLDTTEGTPYSTEVLGVRTQPLYDRAIQQRIAGTLGVVEISSYQSQLGRGDRHLEVTAAVSTLYGAATVETTV